MLTSLRSAGSAVLVAAALPAAAQYNPDFATPEDIDPRVTEIYVDVPVVEASAKTGGAPSDAIVLFDGTDLDAWRNLRGEPAHWLVGDDGAMTVQPLPYPPGGDLVTRDSFADFQLHLEFATPAEVSGEGQGRGNSGVFLQDRYEVQILDNYRNATYSNGQVGSVYKQTPPLANPSRPPGAWQAYDIVYTAPAFSDRGTLLHPAYVTVFHNGVLVQNHTPVQGPTNYRGRGVYEPHGPAPIRLQDHGNPLRYRNIWVRRL